MAHKPLPTDPNLPEVLGSALPEAMTIPLREQLEAAGAPEVVLDHLEPYRDQDIPYLYTGRGAHEAMNGSGGQASDGSESHLICDLMVGTDMPIGDVIASRYDDQTSLIKAQWRSRQYPLKPGAPRKIDREEVEQVGDNIFVRRHYEGVSELGQLDGDLTSIVLLVPSEEFDPRSNYPGRWMWRHFTFYRRNDGFVADRMHVSGATLLNGVQELRNMELGSIRTIKAPMASLISPDIAVQVLSAEAAAELALASQPSNLLVAAEQAVAEHPEVMDRIEQFMTAMAPSVLAALTHPPTVSWAFDMLADGVLKRPDKIDILGKTINILNPNARFEIAQILARSGKSEFVNWYEDHFSDLETAVTSETFDRIRALNLIQFAEAWSRSTGGSFIDPDYRALERDISKLQTHDSEALGYHSYPLTRRIFDGLLTATVTIFIEDYIMAQSVMAKAVEPVK